MLQTGFNPFSENRQNSEKLEYNMKHKIEKTTKFPANLKKKSNI